MDLKTKVIKELKKVIDPETMMDVVSMGLIKDLQISSEGKVSLTFRPSSTVCPLAFPLAFNIQKVVKEIGDVKELEITVTDYQMAEELNNFLKGL